MQSKNLNIYEINTATWLNKLSRQANQKIDLSNVPSEVWDKLASYGFEAVWLMGVWERSPVAIEVNFNDPNFEPEMKQVLPDFEFEKDVIGSAYSIKNYTVNSSFGGDDALFIAKDELNKRGIKLILDFVPNHVAIDNSWAISNPEYFINGTEEDLEKYPGEYIKVNNNIYALGRDPNFKPWSDVLQLNIFSQPLRNASRDLICEIAKKCDGLRCDMAMLVTTDIFKYTWQSKVEDNLEFEYWQEIISNVRNQDNEFIFIAEAYWDTQQHLIDLGFDYCYDKDFYDLLKHKDNKLLRYSLLQPIDYQKHLLRFLENHDEPRAASVFQKEQHITSAIILATIPGAKLYYDGQFQGLKIRTPVQLGRDPIEDIDAKLNSFYKDYIDLVNEIDFNENSWQLCYAGKPQKNQEIVSNSVFAWTWSSNTNTYVVIVNNSDSINEVVVNLPSNNISTNFVNRSVVFNSLYKNNTTLLFEDNCIYCKLAEYESLVIKLS